MKTGGIEQGVAQKLIVSFSDEAKTTENPPFAHTVSGNVL